MVFLTGAPAAAAPASVLGKHGREDEDHHDGAPHDEEEVKRGRVDGSAPPSTEGEHSAAASSEAQQQQSGAPASDPAAAGAYGAYDAHAAHAAAYGAAPPQQLGGYSGYGAPPAHYGAPAGYPPQYQQPPQMGGPPGQPMWIPNDRVGSLIGKQGSNVKRIEMTYGVKMQIAPETTPDRPNERQVTVMPLSGGMQGVAAAEQDVRRHIEESLARDQMRQQGGDAGGALGGGGGMSRGGPGGEHVQIPQACVGLVIGKGGETIKMLQAKTGCHIQITKDAEADPNSPMRSVAINGTPQQMAAARYEIEMIVQQNAQFQAQRAAGGMGGGGAPGGAGGYGPPSGGAPGSTSLTVQVPGGMIGTIIGRGGETIRALQASTGARVQVAKGQDGAPERDVIISGQPHQVDSANAEIQRLLAEKSAGGQFVSFQGGQGGQGGRGGAPTGGRNAPYPDMSGGYGGQQHYGGGGYGGQQAAYGQPPAAAYGQQQGYGAAPAQGGYDYSAYYAQQGQPQQQQVHFILFTRIHTHTNTHTRCNHINRTHALVLPLTISLVLCHNFVFPSLSRFLPLLPIRCCVASTCRDCKLLVALCIRCHCRYQCNWLSRLLPLVISCAS